MTAAERLRSRMRTPGPRHRATISRHRFTLHGRSPTNATSHACIASRKAARARHSATSSTRTMSWASSISSSRRGPVPVVLGRRADGSSALLQDGRVRLRERRQLKIETNGHYLDAKNCERLRALGVKAVQVSLDGATRATFNRMRVLGEFNTAVEGTRNLREPACRSRSTFPRPTSTSARSAPPSTSRTSLARTASTPGRTMYTGNAVKTWHISRHPKSNTPSSSKSLHAKADEYRGRMRVHFHEMGLLEELRYRLKHPAALLIVLPNGLVKLINALPFVCGDLRTQSLAEIWGNFRNAWHDPRVALHRRPGDRSARHIRTAQVGVCMSTLSTVGSTPIRRHSACCASSAWCGIASSCMRGSCLTCSARHGRMRSPASSMPRFLERVSRGRARGHWRGSVQRILRRADGDRPGIQSRGLATDSGRGLLGRRRCICGRIGRRACI